MTLSLRSAPPAITCPGSGSGWLREAAAGHRVCDVRVQRPRFPRSFLVSRKRCCRLVLEIAPPAACHRVVAVVVMTGQTQPSVSASSGVGGGGRSRVAEVPRDLFICQYEDSCKPSNCSEVCFFPFLPYRIYLYFLFPYFFSINIFFHIFARHRCFNYANFSTVGSFKTFHSILKSHTYISESSKFEVFWVFVFVFLLARV